MDPSKFDEFTKALVDPTSRRQALKTIIASAFGGFLTLTGTHDALAHCKPLGKHCRSGDECCSGFCNHKTHKCACPGHRRPCNGQCCPHGSVCVDGECVFFRECPGDSFRCGDHCCPPNTFCIGGECVFFRECPPDQFRCGDHCCPRGFDCIGGECRSRECPPCPDGSVCRDGQCVSFGGGCNPPCGPDSFCRNGQCVSFGGGCNPPCGPDSFCQNGHCFSRSDNNGNMGNNNNNNNSGNCPPGKIPCLTGTGCC